jgi:hypothetical protein
LDFGLDLEMRSLSFFSLRVGGDQIARDEDEIEK